MNPEKIKEYLSLGRIDSALANLLKYNLLDTDSETILITLSGEWSALQAAHLRNELSLDEATRMRNSLTHRILELLEMIEEAMSEVDTSEPLTFIPENLLATFIGRDVQLAEIAQKLQQGQRRLILRSMGGMGKSAFLQKFVQVYRKNYQCLVFLEVSNDKLNPQLAYYEAFTRQADLLKHLQLELPPTLSPQDAFLKVITTLGAWVGNNHLLIMDNVSEAILETFKYLPPSNRWTILASSRQDLDSLEQFDLSALPTEWARQLFYTHYPTVEKADEALDKILQFIDNHTLTIELLAKNAKQRQLSIPDLLAGIELKGLNISQTAKVTTLSAGKAKYTVEHLYDTFSIDLSEDMLTTLLYFSILPAAPIQFEGMKDFLNIQTQEQDAFLFEKWSFLTANGWLQKTNAGYTCPQVIKEVIRLKLKPDSINCQYLIDAFITKLTLNESIGEHGFSKQIYFSAAESVLKHIQEPTERITQLAEKTCIVANHNGFYTKSLQYAYRALAFYEQNQKPEAQNIEKVAGLYQQIVSAHRDLAQLEDALKGYQKAVALIEPQVKILAEAMAKIYTEGALIYAEMQKGTEATKIQQKAVKMFLKLNKNHIYLAFCYNNLARFTAENEVDKRLKYYEDALTLQIQRTGKDHPDTGSIYNNLALAALKAGKTEVALKYSEQSVLTLGKIYPDGHPNLIAGYLNRARSLEAAQQFVDAKTAIQTAKWMAERLLFATHPLQIRIAEYFTKLNG